MHESQSRVACRLRPRQTEVKLGEMPRNRQPPVYPARISANSISATWLIYASDLYIVQQGRAEIQAEGLTIPAEPFSLAVFKMQLRLLQETLVLLLFVPVFSQSTFTSQGCVDPAGFDSCWSSATQAASSLFKKYCTEGQCTDENNCYTPDSTCAQTTTCVAYTMWLNCALSHCWNRVTHASDLVLTCG